MTLQINYLMESLNRNANTEFHNVGVGAEADLQDK